MTCCVGRRGGARWRPAGRDTAADNAGVVKARKASIGDDGIKCGGNLLTREGEKWCGIKVAEENVIMKRASNKISRASRQYRQQLVPKGKYSRYEWR